MDIPLSLSETESAILRLLDECDSISDTMSRPENHKKRDLQQTLDFLQYMLDLARTSSSSQFPERLGSPSSFRRRAIRLMVKLTKHSGILPTVLLISGITCRKIDPDFRGGYADVFLADHVSGRVALKRLRTYTEQLERNRLNEMVCREAAFWRQLEHPNVVPFLGVDRHTFQPLFSLVSPWMNNGNLTSYIRRKCLSDLAIDELLSGACRGLAYLHDQGVIHGDVRADNILINDNREACLTDFGLARIPNSSSGFISSTSHGNVRWLAPGCTDETEKIGAPSDVFSMGRVCLEACTLKIPFHYLSNDVTVAVHICRGVPVTRPAMEECEGRLLSDNLWALMQRCWAPEAKDRPTATQVEVALSGLSQHSAVSDGQLARSNAVSLGSSPWEVTNSYLVTASAAVKLLYSPANALGWISSALATKPKDDSGDPEWTLVQACEDVKLDTELQAGAGREERSSFITTGTSNRHLARDIHRGRRVRSDHLAETRFPEVEDISGTPGCSRSAPGTMISVPVKHPRRPSFLSFFSPHSAPAPPKIEDEGPSYAHYLDDVIIPTARLQTIVPILSCQGSEDLAEALSRDPSPSPEEGADVFARSSSPDDMFSLDLEQPCSSSLVTLATSGSWSVASIPRSARDASCGRSTSPAAAADMPSQEDWLAFAMYSAIPEHE